MKVVLAGSSGLTGKHCLRMLLDDAVFNEIHLLQRKPSAVKNVRIHEHIVDFGKLPALPQADAVICTLGTTMKKAKSREGFRQVDFDYVLKLGQRAREAGIPNFLVVTGMGANPDSTIFYNRVKGEIEEALAALGFQSLCILRPSLILGDRDEVRPGESIGIFFMKLFSPVMLGPFRDYRPVQAEKIASCLIEQARHPQPGITVINNREIREGRR